MLLNQNIQGAGFKFKTLIFILQCFEALGNTTINSTVTIFRDLDHLGLINKLYFDAGFQAKNRVMALWFLKPELFKQGTVF